MRSLEDIAREIQAEIYLSMEAKKALGVDADITQTIQNQIKYFEELKKQHEAKDTPRDYLECARLRDKITELKKIL